MENKAIEELVANFLVTNKNDLAKKDIELLYAAYLNCAREIRTRIKEA